MSTLKNAIRKGDSTSHGGRVLEGIDNHQIMGIPIACKGHMVICPQCKGVFPIIDGVSSMPIGDSERFPAVEGMKTACGAKLIASQDVFKLQQVTGNNSYIEKDYLVRFLVSDSESGEVMKNAKFYASVNDIEFEGSTNAEGYAEIHAAGPHDEIKFHVSFLTPKRPLNKEGE